MNENEYTGDKANAIVQRIRQLRPLWVVEHEFQDCVSVHESMDCKLQLWFGNANEEWGADVNVWDEASKMHEPTGYGVGGRLVCDEASVEDMAQEAVKLYEKAAAIIAVDMERVRFEADAKFWEVVASKYPMITTGDFPPDASFKLNEALDDAIRTWVYNNIS